MKILIYLFGLVLIAGDVFGQSEASASGGTGQIQRPIFTITNVSAISSGIVAYNSTGRYLAVAGDKMIQIYDTGAHGGSAPNFLRTLTAHNAQILGLAFGGTNALVSVSFDQTVKIWDVETGKLLHAAQLQLGKRSVFAIAPERVLAADASFGHVRLWNFRSGEILKTFEPGDSWASALAFTPDEKSLVIGTEKGVLRVMEVATGTITRTIDLDSPIRSLAASSEHIVLGYSDGTVAMLNFGDQPSVPEMKHQTGAINALAFSPAGDRFAAASADRSVKVWETATLKLLSSLKGHGSAVVAVAFSPDEKTIVSVDLSGIVNIWNVLR